MALDFRIEVFGNAEARRTEAEISFTGQSDASEPWAVLYELPSGWTVDLVGSASAVPLGTVLAALSAAREHIEDYVNRRGENAPPGLTRAGLSLWLMEKRDGTAMGKPIR